MSRTNESSLAPVLLLLPLWFTCSVPSPPPLQPCTQSHREGKFGPMHGLRPGKLTWPACNCEQDTPNLHGFVLLEMDGHVLMETARDPSNSAICLQNTAGSMFRNDTQQKSGGTESLKQKLEKH
jgi:hypothetical protein